jgi:hypothetical protein
MNETVLSVEEKKELFVVGSLELVSPAIPYHLMDWVPTIDQIFSARFDEKDDEKAVREFGCQEKKGYSKCLERGEDYLSRCVLRESCS